MIIDYIILPEKGKGVIAIKCVKVEIRLDEPVYDLLKKASIIAGMSPGRFISALVTEFVGDSLGEAARRKGITRPS